MSDNNITDVDLKCVYQLGLDNDDTSLQVQQVIKAYPSYTTDTVINIFKRFIQSRVAFLTQENDFTRICLRKQDVAIKLRSLVLDEAYLVYCTIERQQSLGITARDLTKVIGEYFRRKNLPLLQQTNINKIVKQLVNDKLIKIIKSVHQSGKKLLMLYDLEPSSTIVGGVFYKDGEFNSEFVNLFRDKLYDFIAIQRMVTMAQIVTYINSSNLAHELFEEDIERVLLTLVMDKVIYLNFEAKSLENVYTIANSISFAEFERIPCISCELKSSCEIEDIYSLSIPNLRREFGNELIKNKTIVINEPNGVQSQSVLSSKLTPRTCPYLSQWLRLDMEPWVSKPDNSSKEIDM